MKRGILQLASCLLSVATAITLVALAACAPAPGVTTAPSPTSVATPTTVALPPADGAALYSYISKTDNYRNWRLWLGTQEMYQGRSAVHGAMLSIYVSDSVYSAIQNREKSMPAGGIIVKENYNADRKLAVLTVMYKVKGYDPEHNDWFWAEYGSDGNIVFQGKVENCNACHGIRKDNDYIWTGTPPVAQITAPKDASTVTAGDVQVSVNVLNFRIVDKLGQANVGRE